MDFFYQYHLFFRKIYVWSSWLWYLQHIWVQLTPVKYLPVSNVTVTINQNVFNMSVSMLLYTQLINMCVSFITRYSKTFLWAREEHILEDALFLCISNDVHCGRKWGIIWASHSVSSEDGSQVTQRLYLMWNKYTDLKFGFIQDTSLLLKKEQKVSTLKNA
jgi:hypothetical protein